MMCTHSCSPLFWKFSGPLTALELSKRTLLSGEMCCAVYIWMGSPMLSGFSACGNVDNVCNNCIDLAMYYHSTSRVFLWRRQWSCICVPLMSCKSNSLQPHIFLTPHENLGILLVELYFIPFHYDTPSVWAILMKEEEEKMKMKANTVLRSLNNLHVFYRFINIWSGAQSNSSLQY